MYIGNLENASGCQSSAGQIFGPGGCGAAGPPIEEVGPPVVVDAAFDDEQGVGARLRPTAARPLEPAPTARCSRVFRSRAGTDPS